MSEVRRLKQELEAMKTARRTWNGMYKVLSEYVEQVIRTFEGETEQPQFTASNVYDGTAIFAAQASASALLALMWPGSAASAFEIRPPDDMELSQDEAEFYDEVNKKAWRAFDDPRAQLSVTLYEYMLGQVIYGTSGIGRGRRGKGQLLFRSYGVHNAFVDEGRDGRVNTLFLTDKWSVARLVDEFGFDRVSEKVREKYQNQKYVDDVSIVHVFLPRRGDAQATRGKLAMPFRGVLFEVETDHVILDEGYTEFPIAVTRFIKMTGEKYGRSSGINAVPDIREANALRESIVVATERILGMPKGVMSDGVLGGGVIDLSSNAINVFNSSPSMGNNPPIFDIGQPPDVSAALARLEDLTNSISRHFNIDRLLDFNNSTQMTFGEAQIRDNIRMSSLISIFARQHSEGIEPTVEGGINMLWRDGVFGVLKGSEQEAALLEAGLPVTYMPDRVAERARSGQDVYEVAYRTQAANAAKAERYLSIMDIMNTALQGMQVDPSIGNRVDLHQAIKDLAEIRGVSSGIILADDEFEKRQNAANEQAAQAQGLDAGERMSGMVKNLAQAQGAVQQ